MRLVAALLLLSFILSCNSGIEYPEGGYDYPKRVKGEDSSFYQLPLKDSFSRRDSFWKVHDYFAYKNFNEPNLSIKYNGKDIFRLVRSGFGMPTYMITVSESQIVVKISEPYAYLNDDDSTILSSTERFHLRLFNRFYPFNEARPRYKRYLDSLLIVYPELQDIRYYKRLVEKGFANSRIKKFYTKRIIPITTKQFEDWISILNKSGYWKLSHYIQCDEPPTDGTGFSLEANTKDKYKYVDVGSCGADLVPNFAKACQVIWDLASMNKEDAIYWERTNNSVDTVKLIVPDVPLQDVRISPKKNRNK